MNYAFVFIYHAYYNGQRYDNFRITQYNGQHFLPLMKIFVMKPLEIDPEYVELMKSIGNEIKDLRTKKGISYTKMAEEIGISRNGYNSIELAKSNFQFFSLLRILSYHEIDFFDFINSLKQ